MRPWLLRPPVLLFFSTSDSSGSPLYRCAVDTRTRERRPGEVGLNVISAMRVALGLGHHVDRLAGGQANVCFTPVAATAFAETEGLLLALHVDHVHRFDGDLEQRFHGRLDV